MSKENSLTGEDWKYIAQLLAWVIFSPVSYLFKGFVMSRLWEWFLVPLGVVNPGIWILIGISILFVVMKGNPVFFKDHKADGALNWSVSFLLPLLCWFFGWIFHFFV